TIRYAANGCWKSARSISASVFSSDIYGTRSATLRRSYGRVSVRSAVVAVTCDFAPRTARRLHAANARIFFQQIAVSHSGYVIANCAMQSLLSASPLCPLTKPVGIGNVPFEHPSQHLARPPVHVRHARMIINILVQEFAERSIRFCE